MPGVDRSDGVDDNNCTSIIEEILMSKASHFFLLCSFLSLPFLGAAPALAASPVTFVSGKGADSGNCADPAHPCRTFQHAFDQTSPGGEIKALDPAHYGRFKGEEAVNRRLVTVRVRMRWKIVSISSKLLIHIGTTPREWSSAFLAS
jgi:hypothetical protein